MVERDVALYIRLFQSIRCPALECCSVEKILLYRFWHEYLIEKLIPSKFWRFSLHHIAMSMDWTTNCRGTRAWLEWLEHFRRNDIWKGTWLEKARGGGYVRSSSDPGFVSWLIHALWNISLRISQLINDISFNTNFLKLLSVGLKCHFIDFFLKFWTKSNDIFSFQG